MIHKTVEGGIIRQGLNYKFGNGFTLALRAKDTTYRFRLRLRPLRVFTNKIRHGETLNRAKINHSTGERIE